MARWYIDFSVYELFSFIGRVSIVINIDFPLPASDSAEDIAAAERKRQFDVSITIFI